MPRATLDTLAAQIAGVATQVNNLTTQVTSLSSTMTASNAALHTELAALTSDLLDPETGALPILQETVDAIAAGTGGNGEPPPPPPDTNVYPLTMQPVANFADPVSLGVGPDALVLTLRSYDPVAAPNVLAILLDGVAIAGPLTVTGSEGRPQIFTLHGAWGALPHVVQIVPGGAGNQLNNLSVDGVSFNFTPLVYNGSSTDARGGPDAVNAPRVWDNIGASLTFTLPVEVAPPPTPTGNPIVTGATINGTLHAPASLADLVAATPAGGTLVLPAGTWSGTASVQTACTIKGAGMGTTIIDATGMALARGKAIFVPLVAGVSFAAMTLRGAAVADLNGAGIREDGPGIGWTATNVECTACQDGVLTFASNITLTGCDMHGNGAGDAHSHEMYFNGSPTTVVTLNVVTSQCGSGSTHALKSRAGKTVVSGGSYTGNPGAGADDVTGAVLNFPNGGLVEIIDATITIASAGSDPNTQFVSYATENAANAGAGTTVTLTRVHVVDHSGTGGTFDCGSFIKGNLVIGEGCTYAGDRAPRMGGNWASVTGSFTRAVA